MRSIAAARRLMLTVMLVLPVALLSAAGTGLAQEVRVQPFGENTVLYVMPGLQQALAPTDGVPALVELDWAVEVENQRMAQLIHAVMPRIQNGVVLMLRQMQAEQFHGTAAALNFKRALLTILEGAHPDIRVEDVLLQNLHVY